MTPANAHTGGALLVLDGDVPATDILADLRETHSPIVAADGAALKLHAAGILPDTIIGDLDTLGGKAATFESEGVNVIRLDSQEENDLEKALLWMIEQNISSVTIVGVGGGMTDHALNNFSVIARYAMKLRIALRDASSIAYILPDALFFSCTPGDRISLIPLPAATLRTNGLRWELHDEVLAFGTREGASNEAITTDITVEVGSGVVALFHYPAAGL